MSRSFSLCIVTRGPVPVDCIPVATEEGVIEMTTEDYARLYPDRAAVLPPLPEFEVETHEVYDGNLTYNLVAMADEAGIYRTLYRPEELGYAHGRDLIDPLAAGLVKLLADPDHYRTFNPPNGWGDYEGLVTVVRDYLRAARHYPHATVWSDSGAGRGRE